MIAETKYRSPIEVGKYTESTSENEKAKRESSVSANSTLKTGATLSRPIFSVQGQVEADEDWHGNNSTERAIKVTKDLYEVEAIPNGWRVGDRQLGDPLKRGALLSGPYFGRPQPDYDYTCWVEFADQADAGSLTVVVAVHDGLQVERLDGHMATDNDLDAAERAMRDKLAAIRIERDKAGAGTISDAQGEMPLYIVVCRCERGDDLGAEAGEAPRLVPSPTALLEGPPPRPAAKAKRARARSPRAKP
ncbi:hypothetical protein GCM10010833_23440 [Blastomonas aquatica]|uniref:Uncharacterized protein n=1 Tax=Blastomonas aquatica TaxID=1510276 RepID=A0ABQ1JG85_9SPHN|nr:hypothetical protein GCM10010833_23440 [Blastomonas aquatica]